MTNSECKVNEHKFDSSYPSLAWFYLKHSLHSCFWASFIVIFNTCTWLVYTVPSLLACVLTACIQHQWYTLLTACGWARFLLHFWFDLYIFTYSQRLHHCRVDCLQPWTWYLTRTCNPSTYVNTRVIWFSLSFCSRASNKLEPIAKGILLMGYCVYDILFLRRGLST